MTAIERTECKALIDEAVKAGARKKKAAELLGISLRTIQRWDTRPEDGRKGPISSPSNALTPEERAKVLEVVNSPEFASMNPWQIVPTLADRDIYIGSESTIYRILRKKDLLTHRSNIRPKKHEKPKELVATGPNKVWTWDITYLRARIRGIYYYLYLIVDIFSRKIVYWEVHDREAEELSSEMIAHACEQEGIEPGQLTVHADNGNPMRGSMMRATLAMLVVAASFSRPRVSNDNPFSEALFKTLKYCPAYPENGWFESIEQAKKWVGSFVDWYNHIHLHSGINWISPANRHANRDQEILEKRHKVYEAARIKNPDRWSTQTRNWKYIDCVVLSPDKKEEANGLKKKAA